MTITTSTDRARPGRPNLRRNDRGKIGPGDGIATCLAFGIAIALTGLAPSANAHGRAGARFFPSTIAIEDPAVADELTLPIFSRFNGAREIEGEYSRRLARFFSVSIEAGRTREAEDGEILSGFENIETSFRYQFLTSAKHETILSAGLGIEWGGTGSARLELAPYNSWAPTLFFGKGLGDLPENLRYLRPLALTGQAAYVIPGRRIAEDGDPIASEFNGGFTVQYSLSYLNSQIRGLALPGFFARLTPVTEFSFAKAVHRGEGESVTGTIQPGFFWIGKYFQLGAEAVVPLNDRSGRRTGFALQAHFFLDDIFPGTIGKPLWGRTK